ncbi:MAG: hypothetical protein ACM3WP_25760 [Acidobacteriota bacterium]
MQTGWFEKLSGKFLSWFSKREVKTPLSFFFRVVGAVSLIAIAGMWLCDPAQRITVFLVSVAALVFMVFGVGLFAWVRPKHLVYGETGHRAEFRLTMGTEAHELEAGEVAKMPGTSNPQTLLGHGENS